METSYQFILWTALFCYLLHMLEEYFYNWKDWANKTFKVTASWTDFYVVNMFVIFMGVCCASIGWDCMWLALIFPGFMAINGFFFHILPILFTRNFSPGIFTTCLLFIPVVYYSYKYGIENGATTTDIIISLVLGAIFMAYPIVLQKTKHLKFFKQ